MLGKLAVALTLASAVAAAVFVQAPSQAGKRAAGDSSLSFAAAGDLGRSARASSTFRNMARQRPSFILALGDLSYAGPGSERAWCAFVKQRVGRIPVELISGNHEDDTGADGRITKFARCLPDRLGAHGAYGQEYFFDYRKLARFILVSPDLTIQKKYIWYGKHNAHLQWLKRTIEGARAEHIPWVVVAMHKSCLSVGEYYCNIYQEALSLLVREKVDLVLQAHDHTYQRTHALAAASGCPTVVIDKFNRACVADSGSDGSYVKGKGAVFVVVGTGGAPLYPVSRTDPEAGYFATYMGRNHNPRWGFLQVHVTRTRLEARFVPSTSTSRFRDRFAIAVR
jgi:Calcineurin-like phosphoesterase